ncbi:MAG: gliding motility-associated C-terminal domain-containing protein, partial [Sphingobacteriaceae bacterium]
EIRSLSKRLSAPSLGNIRLKDSVDELISAVAATNGANGSTTVDANGRITYTPTTGFSGIDTYTYTLSTNDGVISNPITVIINVRPAGVNDNVITPINTPVTIDVKANDGESGVGATVTPGNPGHGTATVTPTGQVVYTPNPDYMGKDTFTYTLTKDGITSPPITVNVSVKPVGVNDVYLGPVNKPITSPVKANDGPSGTGTTVVATNGAHGTTTVTPSGEIIYTPANGYVGPDTYTYTLVTPDGVVSDPVTVRVTIFSSSLSLTKVASSTGTSVGTVINYTFVVKNTGNVNITAIQLTDARVDPGSISPASIATLAPGESATITAKHTITQADLVNGTFSNQAGVTGRDPGNNVVADPESDDPNTPAPNDPTVVRFNQVASVIIEKTGVATPTSITYTFKITNKGSVTLNTFRFTDTNLDLTNTPVTNVPVGGLLPGQTITFTYPYTLTQADKDAGKVTNIATITALDPLSRSVTDDDSITIQVGRSPIAIDDNYQTNIDAPLNAVVVANDNAGSSTFDLQTVEVVKQPEHGTVIVNENGTITYTPNPGYSGTDTFSYKLRDELGYSTNVATVTITVYPFKGPKIPNLFTPNGDGINDTFEIRGLPQGTTVELVIVNRWGNEVYKNANYQNTWTGEGLNEGTYYYIIEMNDAVNNQRKVYKGYVTLMRSFKK